MAGESAGGWIAAAGVVGALAGALVTGAFNYFGHKSDLDAKMIELSVGILRAEPTPETSPLREWAIDVIDKRANFSFNAAQRATLLKKELPFKGSFSSAFSAGFEKDLKGWIVVPPNMILCPNLFADEKQRWTCPASSECGPAVGACITK
jgi:hypothetical protein